MEALSILLSRIQMGFTLGMHIIFPALNIGLALFICIMEGLWLKTRNPLYLKICQYWIKIFALAFGMGVVTGIVMAYELGTNFGRFTEAVGGVVGPLFVYEVLSAFFLEAGFLGIMLFGWKRVGPKMHFCATLMVMIGTFISAFWIMSANSWMQTPAGFSIENGEYQLGNWLDIIFNPSFIARFIHMILASYITCCFFIAGISAWYLLRNRHLDVAKKSFSFALKAALILVPLQIFIGDHVGLIIKEYQPLKTAAIEAVWDTQKGAPLILFGYPDSKTETNRFVVSIPYGASLLNTHQLEGELQGLKSVAENDRPPVAPVFYSFRIMVGIGVLFLLIAFAGVWLDYKKRLYTTHWFARLCLLATPLGFVATLTGWVTAEIGRQPWVVYGLMRTSNGASLVPALHVMISLAAFVIIYSFIFSFFLYYLCNVIKKGPPEESQQITPDEPHPFMYMVPEE